MGGKGEGEARPRLTKRQRSRNRRNGSVRAKVEHVFRVLKCQFGYRKVRYRGIAKNGAQVFALLALANCSSFAADLRPLEGGAGGEHLENERSRHIFRQKNEPLVTDATSRAGYSEIPLLTPSPTCPCRQTASRDDGLAQLPVLVQIARHLKLASFCN